jgi:branched-subunit amino acid aminotransferase/4-amino-4-deoxychorismate lyase
MSSDAPYLFLNGRIVPVSEAAISPFDIGLLRGYAVFDLLRTVDGWPFLLAEHLRRLRNSADALGLVVPYTDDEIAAAIDDLLALNNHHEATVRLVLTGGESPDGLSFSADTPTFFILTHELKSLPASVYESGGKLLTKRHRREVPEAKTTNYLTMLRHHDEIVDAGALDLLYHDGEHVAEAASASFYVVRGGAVFAPGDSVLWGTVGSLVLNLAEEQGTKVVLGDLRLEDALGADEAFLTSTTRGVVPIVALDDHPIGDGTVGPVTQELMAAYERALLGAL